MVNSTLFTAKESLRVFRPVVVVFWFVHQHAPPFQDCEFEFLHISRLRSHCLFPPAQWETLWSIWCWCGHCASFPPSFLIAQATEQNSWPLGAIMGMCMYACTHSPSDCGRISTNRKTCWLEMSALHVSQVIVIVFMASPRLPPAPLRQPGPLPAFLPAHRHA